MNLSESIQCNLDPFNEGNIEADAVLDQLINNMPDSIFIKDTESRFVVANKAVAEIMGFDSPKDLLGKRDVDVYPAPLATKYLEDEQEIIQSGKPKLNIVEPVLCKNVDIQWYSTSKVPLWDREGKVLGIIGIGRNITESVLEKEALCRAKEKAEESDKLKSEFIANISHEIRTPLNGILGLLQLFGEADPRFTEYREEIDMVLKSGQRLTQLVDNMLELSLLHAGQLHLDEHDSELLEFIQSTADHFQKQLLETNKPIKFAFYCSQSLPYSLRLDWKKIRKILVHLLDNALSYTKEGAITLKVSMEPNGSLQFEIKDTGIGFAPESITKAFDPFWQEDSSNTREHEGAGLGLAICDGIVSLMKGSISLKTDKTNGTCVTVSIPISEPE